MICTSTFSDRADERVYDFRKTISKLTNVPPERQKLVGLLHGRNLSLKEGVVKFTMIGTPEDQSFKENQRGNEIVVSRYMGN
jgi:hypothetical protein